MVLYFWSLEYVFFGIKLRIKTREKIFFVYIVKLPLIVKLPFFLILYCSRGVFKVFLLSKTINSTFIIDGKNVKYP